MEKLGLD